MDAPLADSLTLVQKFPRYDTAANRFEIGLESLDETITTQTDEDLYGNVYFIGPRIFAKKTHRIGSQATQQQVLRLNIPRESATQLEESDQHAVQIVFSLVPEARDERVCGRAVFLRVIPRQMVGRLPRDLDSFRAAHVWVSNDLE